MSEQNVQATDITSVRNINTIIFCGLVILALIGVVITDVSPEIAHAYWVGMLVVYGLSAMYCGKKRATIKGGLAGIVVKQIIHWTATLVAVLCVYSLLHTGSLSYDETGIIILLIIALGTFLAGIQVGIYFYALGFLLALATVIVAYVEEFMWIIVIAAMIIVVSVYFWNRRKNR
ncbi:MAG: hypothetical protein K0U68_16530 [Gammaproteobacteria bacterium]|nr:hypothetical protein [Gammaproteobacteria bacterium]